jgi:glycogen debranching enzyme
VCEIQAFTFYALRSGAKLAELLGLESRAQQLRVRAHTLREKFEAAFWCEEIGCYALALDGQKRQCKVRASNVGQCLFAEIASPERAERIADLLSSDDFFSGWGIRTLGRREARYNPMGYHTGSIWPHDNALIALGLSRYGLNDRVLPITSGLFEAGTYFDLNRMPELFCGFRRQASEGPVLYPVACAPQAWAAGSVFMLLQACLGLEVDAPRRVLRFNQPKLPPMVDWLELRNLRVQDAVVDIALQRHTSDVGVNVLRREGLVRTIVEK